jgi:hypothetical protein
MTACIFFAEDVHNTAYKAYAAIAAYRRATGQQSMRFGAPAALNVFAGAVCVPVKARRPCPRWLVPVGNPREKDQSQHERDNYV